MIVYGFPLLCRELYTEKEVIVEERRARYENSPLGRFTGDYLLQVRRSTADVALSSE